jgi:hypothetical protein
MGVLVHRAGSACADHAVISLGLTTSLSVSVSVVGGASGAMFVWVNTGGRQDPRAAHVTGEATADMELVHIDVLLRVTAIGVGQAAG